MLRGMNKRVLFSIVALSVVSLTGCPEKKADEPASGKSAATAAPANAPAASAAAPKQGGGW
jgi:hypothetical protein